MLIVRYLLVLLVLLGGTALSKDPIPSELKEGASPQHKPQDRKKQAADDKRGTEQQPLFIKIVDTPKAGPKPTKDEEEGGDKPAFIWGMTAEEAIAIFTLLLVIVGTLTAMVLVCQSILLRQTVKLGREEFLSTHRPKIRIKHVYPVGEIWAERPVEIKLLIVNTGLTTAHLRQFNIARLILEKGLKLPPRPNYPEQARQSDIPSVDSGVTVPYQAWSIGGNLTQVDNDRIRGPHATHNLYIYGFVEYADAKGQLRTTAFCRVWEPPEGIGTLGRLNIEKEPDYEYQD